MGKLSIPRLALAITISGLFLFAPTDSFAAKKIWLERQLEKLFSEQQRKAPKRRKPRPAQSAAGKSNEIRLPATAPVPQAAPTRLAAAAAAPGVAAPGPAEAAIPVPEDKQSPLGETVAQDNVHPSDKPLENAPAEPPKPEFRPDEAEPDQQAAPDLPEQAPAEKPDPRPEEKPAAPLDTAPAEPPKPEFRPDKPSPEAAEPKAAEPAEPPPPPDPRSALRADASGKLPAEEVACRKRLTELGVRFEESKAEWDPAGCSMPYPLVVKSLGSGTEINPEAEMNCAMAETAARFAKDVVSPAAQKAYGQTLKSISHASAYVCRPRNGSRKLSEHAFGNALDIASFTLSDGTAIGVEPHPDAKTAGFFGQVRRAACGPFKTVLGPGSNADHAEHFHLDLAPRRSGATVCE